MNISTKRVIYTIIQIENYWKINLLTLLNKLI